MRRAKLGRMLFGLVAGIAFLGGLLFFGRPTPLDLPLNSAGASALAVPAETRVPPSDQAASPGLLSPVDAAADAKAGNNAAPASRPPVTAEAKPGDTTLKLLTRMGVSADDARAAARTVGTVWNPHDLRPGQKVTLSVQGGRLQSFRLALGPAREIAAARNDAGDFIAEDQARPTSAVRTFGAGKIATSLSRAVADAGIPMAVVGEMIRAFSYDVDFQREVKAGDTFAMLYDHVHDEAGEPTSVGQLVYAEMVLSGKPLRLYRFAPPNGEAGFYNALGENTRKPLLRTPVDGAGITSGFGMRFHPILGFSRMHQGVDFGVPSGTPVFAAGDGKVVQAGRNGGYGNYIEIEHSQQYATAYAHLSGFAAGLRDGQRVRQGEVIGYVGMTGLATGPHLHYEVHYHNAPIDPLSVRMPATTRLAGADLKAFQAVRRSIDGELERARPGLVAHADGHTISAP
jgi:murein DD-endopeptidase MepM/ murein hydrolase activator NlpD